MMLWRSDGDEKLLPSLAARPSVRVQRYYYFWVWGTYTCSVHTHTHIHCHHIYKGARARTYTHSRIYILCTHTIDSPRWYEADERRESRARDDWLMPSRSPVAPHHPTVQSVRGREGSPLTYGRKTCVPWEILLLYRLHRYSTILLLL